MERLRAALENLDQAIDMAENALSRRQKDLEKMIDARAEKRVKAATETAERALKQAREREADALAREKDASTREKDASARETRQRELTARVAGRLDDAIVRIGRMVGE